MNKRIKDNPVIKNELNNDLFYTYKKAIGFYLGNPKEEQVYVEDEEIQNKLLRLILEEDTKIIYLLGKAGIGKTTLIKNIFHLSDSSVVFDNTKDIIYVSMNFRDKLLESDTDSFVVNCIAAVCTALEEKYNIGKQFYSIDGHLEFYEFIKKIDAEILEYCSSIDLIGKSSMDAKLLRLSKAEEKNPYKYVACRLMFYLIKYCRKFNNITIVVDNIEVLSPDIRFRIIRNCLALFSGLDKIRQFENEQYTLKLLMSMRQATFDELNKREEIRAYRPVTVQYKENPVDMCSYFELKRETLVDFQGMKTIWDDSYDIILDLENKFGRKYSTMIKNLCNYDFQLMKKCYKKVLTNMVWLIRGDRVKDFFDMPKPDSLFNNISVIRSIACGNNAVYRGEKSGVLPNIFLNDEFQDNSLISLLVLYYIIENGKIIKRKRLVETFDNIFADECIQNRLSRVIEHFLLYDILEETHKIKKDNTYLAITPRGKEIFDMFETDSVLLEAYREDYFFEEEDANCNFKSSYALMLSVGQAEIFFQLFGFIRVLFQEEKKLYIQAKENGKLEEYYTCFGKEMQVKRLLGGVIKSIEYSGHRGVWGIESEIEELEHMLKF